ncbi:uncharacterized protein WCC33_014423 isoform 3-T3 [Rhinophrynus dorsalis]
MEPREEPCVWSDLMCEERDYPSVLSTGCGTVKTEIMDKMEQDNDSGLRRSQRSDEMDSPTMTRAGNVIVRPDIVIKMEQEEEPCLRRGFQAMEREPFPETNTGLDVLNPKLAVKMELGDESGLRSYQHSEDEDGLAATSAEDVKIKEVDDLDDVDNPQFEEKGSPLEDTAEATRAALSHRLDITSGNEIRRGMLHACVKMSMSRLLIKTDVLIAEVQKRPALYDRHLTEYRDKIKRRDMWDEVCERVIPEWHECTDEEKSSKAKEVQTRWRSLKDCFRRELILQKKEGKDGSLPTKRKQYVFFERLLFLLPILDTEPNRGNGSESRATSKASLEKSDGSDTELVASPCVQQVTVTRPPAKKYKRHKATEMAEFEDEIIGFMEKMKNLKELSKEEEKDEDKLFLLSLLPAMKRVPKEKKMDLKIEMMQVLQRAVSPTFHSTPQNTPPHCHQAPYYRTQTQNWHLPYQPRHQY